jgi:hypothetical protein
VTEQVSAQGIGEVFEVYLPNVLLRGEAAAQNKSQHKNQTGHTSSLKPRQGSGPITLNPEVTPKRQNGG